MLRETRIKFLKAFSFSSILVGLALACSPVSFKNGEVAPTPPVGCTGDLCVVVEPGEPLQYTYAYTVPSPSVDILIVNDNSASMRDEQEHMGSRFGNFLSHLNGIDWRIGMITMDISNTYRELDDYEAPNTTNNPSEYYDGNLVSFTNGQKYITPQTNNYEDVFKNSVEMDVYGSGDERGIFTLSLAIEKNGPLGSNFLRGGAHLAVIFLTDEDVRDNAPTSGAAKLRARDKKEYLFNQLNNLSHANGGTAKAVSIHSIIARPTDPGPSPSTKDCITYLNEETPYGAYYGRMYEDLSNDSRTQGIVGSICADDYGDILSDMGQFVSDRTVKEVTLPGNCMIIQNDSKYPLQVYVNGSEYSSDYYELVGNRVVFTPALSSGTEIYTSFFCEPEE